MAKLYKHGKTTAEFSKTYEGKEALGTRYKQTYRIMEDGKVLKQVRFFLSDGSLSLGGWKLARLKPVFVLAPASLSAHLLSKGYKQTAGEPVCAAGGNRMPPMEPKKDAGGLQPFVVNVSLLVKINELAGKDSRGLQDTVSLAVEHLQSELDSDGIVVCEGEWQVKQGDKRQSNIIAEAVRLLKANVSAEERESNIASVVGLLESLLP